MTVLWPKSLLFPKLFPWKLMGKMMPMERTVSRMTKKMMQHWNKCAEWRKNQVSTDLSISKAILLRKRF